MERYAHLVTFVKSQIIVGAIYPDIFVQVYLYLFQHIPQCKVEYIKLESVAITRFLIESEIVSVIEVSLGENLNRVYGFVCCYVRERLSDPGFTVARRDFPENFTRIATHALRAYYRGTIRKPPTEYP